MEIYKDADAVRPSKDHLVYNHYDGEVSNDPHDLSRDAEENNDRLILLAEEENSGQGDLNGKENQIEFEEENNDPFD